MYPDNIMRNVRQRFGIKPDDTSRDSRIMSMSKERVFEDWLAWQGVIGYGDSIISAINDIYGLSLGE